MSRKVKTISLQEFSSNPEAFIDEVIRRHEQVIIENEEGALAVLRPIRLVKRSYKKNQGSEASYEAFLGSAGGWAGLVDTEKLKSNIYESRRISSRPPVEL